MFVLVPTGDLSSQSSDTLMSLRTTPIPQVVSVGSAGVHYPAGSLGCVVVQCAPRAWRTGAGEGCRLFGLLHGDWMCCVWGGGNMRRGSLLHGGLVLIAYQSTTPVRASPKTAVN